jgi:hypothetical protein
VPTISSIRQITAKIISFKEINYEKLLASNNADHLISLISEDDSFFYEINIANGNANFNDSFNLLNKINYIYYYQAKLQA